MLKFNQKNRMEKADGVATMALESDETKAENLANRKIEVRHLKLKLNFQLIFGDKNPPSVDAP
jgi:hypothetical protein